MHLKMPIVFDNDCIASFSWINRLDIINTLFRGQIIIPQAVYNELAYMKKTKFYYVFENIEREVESKNFTVKDIGITDPYLKEYLRLIAMDNPKKIGKGEAAAIVLAKSLNGTLASNNLSDVLPYIKDNQPPLICTEHILYYYWKANYITVKEGQAIWQSMKDKKRKLPIYNFDYVITKFNTQSELLI
ncbi:hypothetical protein [Thermosediminibacter oceani]|uniref:PIN domain-containing protein n=1 Tax=Thermosediminibacter oceani (strain ATCC BAA-1034 / DSM 16646 / JW/IW-1228P) TaxID=555079 RepID=D9S0K5_THEOJ|nr:hypothetical protein [Thermosediminibacter oceani]ADL08863.1 conserved hypothetical protein [Thermosediminibacter oceani DSM 16646]